MLLLLTVQQLLLLQAASLRPLEVHQPEGPAQESVLEALSLSSLLQHLHTSQQLLLLQLLELFRRLLTLSLYLLL